MKKPRKKKKSLNRTHLFRREWGPTSTGAGLTRRPRPRPLRHSRPEAEEEREGALLTCPGAAVPRLRRSRALPTTTSSLRRRCRRTLADRVRVTTFTSTSIRTQITPLSLWVCMNLSFHPFFLFVLLFSEYVYYTSVSWTKWKNRIVFLLETKTQEFSVTK